jgi:hypothetical protein
VFNKFKRRTKMQWKFWEKKSETGSPKPNEIKLPGPKDIDDLVGRNLVVQFGKNPDWVWHLKNVLRQKADSKSIYDVRVFSQTEAAEKRVNVKNYLTLDAHPDLILFEGWFDKNSKKIELEDRSKKRAA